MKTIISYDKEAEMGYITLQGGEYPNIVRTDDVNEEAAVMVDINDKESIYGIELGYDDAWKLKDIRHQQRIFRKNSDGYSLWLNEHTEVKSREHMLGVDFLFGETNFSDLIGIEIKDLHKYSRIFLDQFTKID